MLLYCVAVVYNPITNHSFGRLFDWYSSITGIAKLKRCTFPRQLKITTSANSGRCGPPSCVFVMDGELHWSSRAPTSDQDICLLDVHCRKPLHKEHVIMAVHFGLVNRQTHTVYFATKAYLSLATGADKSRQVLLLHVAFTQCKALVNHMLAIMKSMLRWR